MNGTKAALLQSSTPKTHLGNVKAAVTDSNNVRTGVISYTATLSAAVMGFIG